MKIDKFKYHILWIDDKCKKETGFITNANMNGIGVTDCAYGKDGIDELRKNINYYDGVVLDVKCQYEKTDLDIADNFYKIKDELIEIKSTKRPALPYFVYSAQPDIIDNKMFLSSLNGKKLYEKVKDDNNLIKDIITAADALLETQIRLKYLRTLPFSELYNELTEILTFVEQGKTANPDPIAKTRLVLNWVMDYCNEVGILPVKHNGSNLNECSVFLGRKEMRPYVPVHIQRSFHSAVEISNNGSHRVEVFETIRSNQAPFLVRSTVFELLNILTWCAGLPVDEQQREAIRQEVSKIENTTIYEGNLLKDEHNNWHCGDFLINYKSVEEMNLQDGDIINISKTERNSKQSVTCPYPMRAVIMTKI